jgi:hypothetical protein
MKTWRFAVLTTFALTSIALGQDVFSPQRNYIAGEKDNYALSMKMVTGAYDVSIIGKLVYTTKKVFDNGDADIESLASDVTVTVMGQESKQPASEPRLSRYNKFGAPLNTGGDPTKRQPAFMGFLTYRPSVPMKVGEPVKVDEALGDAAKTTVKGSAKLESVVDGVAKISSSLDVGQKDLKKPMHIDSVSYLDVKSSKLNRAESKLTNVDAKELQGIPGVNSITVVIERERAAG